MTDPLKQEASREEKCPKCGEPLKRVKQPSEGPYSMLNADQWQSTIPGDLFCTCHNNNRGNKPYAYFWKHEVGHKGSAPAQMPQKVKDVCHVCGTKASYGYLGRYCSKCNVSRPIESAPPVETPKVSAAKVKADKARRFITEYQYAVGSRPFVNLPDPSFIEMPTVVIPKETVVKFRNDYALLLEFASLTCQKPAKELTPMDLSTPFFLEVQKLIDAENFEDLDKYYE